MSIPRFTAEATLYKTGGHYRTGRRATGLPARMTLNPAMIPDETIHIYSCGPGLLQLGEGPNITCVDPYDPFGSGGYGGGGGGIPDPVDGYGGGGWQGGGGRGGPREMSGGTRRMDKSCNKQKFAKLCPKFTDWQTCARLRCQANYCDTHPCTEDEEQAGKEAKTMYADIKCEDRPCPAQAQSHVLSDELFYR